MSKSKQEGTKGVIFGAATGSLEIIITYPIKYVKTQLQLEQQFGKSRKYAGVFDCMKQTYTNFGIHGLYRGLNIFLYGPKAAIRFGAFEAFKAKLQSENGTLSSKNKFLCGIGAGAIEAVLVNTPLETVEVKLINDQRLGNPRFRGFLHGVSLIIKEEGFRGIYQGMPASVLKQASNQGIRFFVVESLRELYTGGDPTIATPKLWVGLFGGIAGFCSVIGNNPIDVVKTRMQGLYASKYKNTFDCFIKITREEGFLSFYRGVTPRLSRVCLEVALTFMIYDILKDSFSKS